jgi:RNA polymerase sigma-70 factor (ECF subfamily)
MTMMVKKIRSSRDRTGSAGASRAEVSRQFEALFLDQWPAVYGTLLRLVGDPYEAEDLALETFVRLYQRAPQNQAEGLPGDSFNAGGWLRRVATRLGLNALRGGKRRQRYEGQAGLESLTENGPDNPAEVFIAREQRRRVRQILGDMQPRKAQLLVLRYSGMSYQEIAAALGLAPTSIGPLLYRAEQDFARRYRTVYPQEAGDASE